MEIFLQNVVQMDHMEIFLRIPIIRIKRPSDEKFLRFQILQKSYKIPLNQRSPEIYHEEKMINAMNLECSHQLASDVDEWLVG